MMRDWNYLHLQCVLKEVVEKNRTIICNKTEHEMGIGPSSTNNISTFYISMMHGPIWL